MPITIRIFVTVLLVARHSGDQYLFGAEERQLEVSKVVPDSIINEESPKSVQKLMLFKHELCEQSRVRLKEFTGLRELWIFSSPHFSEDNLEFLRSSRLRVLRTVDVQFGGKGTATLESLQQLEGCHLIDAGITDSELREFAIPKKVVNFTIDGNSVGNRSIEHICDRIDAHSLRLGRTDVSDELMSTLVSEKKLLKLSVNGTGISDKSAADFCNMRNLQTLDVSNTEISNDGIVAICRHPKLATLSVSGITLSHRALQSLKTMKTMKTMKTLRLLIAADCGLTASRLELLLKDSFVTAIWLGRKDVSDRELQTLRSKFGSVGFLLLPDEEGE